MKIGNDACKARQLALRERATAPISSSNNLVRVDYSTALFSLNSTLWNRSESCILKSLGYIREAMGLSYIKFIEEWQLVLLSYQSYQVVIR
ncbi:hypothetical protein [Vibrio caribbeanicus]|uniref:hypothetical protein n=1 Tax=Vibrio caribbeanicus TaxID=701175 RepID=UPI0030DA803C